MIGISLQKHTNDFALKFADKTHYWQVKRQSSQAIALSWQKICNVAAFRWFQLLHG